MTRTNTATNQGLDPEEDQKGGRVPPRRMSLPGNPEGMFIDEAYRELRPAAFRERFIDRAATARPEQATIKQFLLDLLQVDRDVRRQQPRLQLARFPRPKPLEDFGLAKNLKITPEVFADLKSPAWVREECPFVLTRDSGTGKSHLFFETGTAIAEAGLAVRSTTPSALVNKLAEADAGRGLSTVTARYSKIGLLRLNEFGYRNLDRKSAKLLIRIFTEREECKATAVTNSPFAEAFGDTRLCAAIADRITLRCTLIQAGTDSYRLQATESEHRVKAQR